jgi:hypothetical protein
VKPTNTYDGKFLAAVSKKIRELYTVGINPIPAYGSKAPKNKSPKAPAIDTWKEWQEKRMPAAMIEEMILDIPESVGALGGAYAGNLEALDFDSMDAYERFLEAGAKCGLADLIERIASGYDERSPKGRHYLYRIDLAPGKPMPGNEKWARTKPDAKGKTETLIETRGEGGYVILAPSFNDSYSMVTGGVESIVTISFLEREQLKAVAAMVCENPEPEKPKAKNIKTEPEKPNKTGISVSLSMPSHPPLSEAQSRLIKVSEGTISHFNNSTTWKDLLTADGWIELYTQGAKTFWKRPGKDGAGCSGVSGPGGKAKGDSFTCFSSNGPSWLPVGTTVSRFDYVMYRDHGGNMKAFLVALRGELKTVAPAENGKPDLLIDFDETRITADAYKILEGDEWLYRKGTAIVTPTVDTKGGRQSKFLSLVQVAPSFIRSRIMQRCRPVRERISKGGEVSRVPCGYPEFLSKSIESSAHNGELNPLPSITGILQGPVINERGELVNRNGYHLIGGLGFYQTGAIEGLTLPEKTILKDEAADALERVLDLLTDFGFADSELDPLKWVAMVLTQLVRPIIDFCPLWIVTANTSRAGKTILIDALGLICHGMRPARTGFPQNPDRRDEELSKIISGFAFEGRSLLTFDNLTDGTQVRSDELCRNATSEMIQNRQLHGHNQIGGMNVGQFILNGNNISPASDIIGRTVLIQVKCNDPNPGLRNSKVAFKHGALDTHIEKNRIAILRDFLTIVAAYIQNGRPETPGKSIAGFDAWTDLVCGSIRWASGLDPIDRTNEEARAFDEQSNALESLVKNWTAIFGDLGTKVSQVFKKISAEDPDDHASGLADALAILYGKDIRHYQNIAAALKKFRDKKIVINSEPDSVYTILAMNDSHAGGFRFQIVKAVR